MAEFGIGQPVRRKEDRRFLTGSACYTDDLHFENEASLAFLRSPYAHARIVSMQIDAARALPGVIAVVTGEDVDAHRLGTMVCETALTDRTEAPLFKPVWPVLPRERVRYVGQPVVAVVAETLAQARDAVDLLDVVFEELPPVVSAMHSLAEDAPRLHEGHPDNVALHWESCDPARVEMKLAAAVRRVVVDIVNNRVIPSPMEPRVAIAVHDTVTDRTTLYAPTQGGRRLQTRLCQFLGVTRDRIRVVSRDTGGGFGTRSSTYPEQLLIVWIARKLGRPVRWRSDRSETFVSDYHGRAQESRAEMGLDSDGRIVALKVETVANLGAFLTENGARLPIAGGGSIIPCAYDIDAFYLSVRAVFTSTVPTETYRGAGRPEANYLMERLLDAAADACGLARDEIRRRNLIPQAKLPYTTQMGLTFDSGDFQGTMEKALIAADWQGFPERQKSSAARGLLRGIGLAMFIAPAGAQLVEEMRIRVAPDGAVGVTAGTYSHGQGHETVYAQVVSELLGVPPEAIELSQGDTDDMPVAAIGTFGSRSSMMGANALKRACADLVDTGRKIAAELLQADPADVAFVDGSFRTESGSVSLREVARTATEPACGPGAGKAGLESVCVLEQPAMNFPNGCHVCEVEVDPETGLVSLVGYSACDDCGVLLNPLIVHGQVHGGIAQGIGQALTEHVVYDSETGQLLTGSYMDYGMPRAVDLPRIVAIFNEVPCLTNDMGVKGAGEAGACGAPPALVSAVLDALKPLGIEHMDMPLTPARVWSAIYAAEIAGA